MEGLVMLKSYLIFALLGDGTTRAIDPEATTEGEALYSARLYQLAHPEVVSVRVKELSPATMYTEDGE